MAPGPYLLRRNQAHQSLSSGRPIAGPENDPGVDAEDEDEDEDEESSDSTDGGSDYGSDRSDRLDIAILTAVGGDIDLAVALIPHAHKLMRKSLQDKIDSWQIELVDPADAGDSYGTGSGSINASGSPESTRGNRGGRQTARKRQRNSDSDNDQDEYEEEEGGAGTPGFLGLPQEAEKLLLACPFHKYDPAKYGIQHLTPGASRKDTYRACAGPGFKSIQRLKYV